MGISKIIMPAQFWSMRLLKCHLIHQQMPKKGKQVYNSKCIQAWKQQQIAQQQPAAIECTFVVAQKQQ